jgi:predicted acylesterase/phospholipase RssA
MAGIVKRPIKVEPLDQDIRGRELDPGHALKRLSLALQGGGALGAFTLGVLDRLLEEDITFDAVSGSSAGAMNAVLLASGLAKGGRGEARASLRDQLRSDLTRHNEPRRRLRARCDRPRPSRC